MEPFVLFLLVSCLAVTHSDSSSVKWDNVNVDEILRSERLLKNYRACLMERGSCSPEGSELKRILKSVLHSDCLECTKKQKENFEKVVSFLREKKPEWWGELEEKYDPQKLYTSRHFKENKAAATKKLLQDQATM